METRSVEVPGNASYTVATFSWKDKERFAEQLENFILSKWLRSLKYGNDFFKLIDQENYFTYYENFIKLILGRESVQVKLAHLTSNPDVFLGFSIFEGKTLHYIYVHKDARREGIGFSLLPKEIETITHLTKLGLQLWPKLIPWASFKPFI